jgi:ribosomal protein L29
MKLNDRKELHSKTVEELEKLLKEAYNTLSQARLDNEQNKLKNTRSMTITRKEIAVMKTILNEKAKAAKLETKEVAEAPSK